MPRHIPGTLFVKGREFFYIETVDAEGFGEVVDAA
jgi:hypothetical protein